MTRFSTDFTNTEDGFVLIPEGDHKLKVVACYEKESSTGNLMVVFELETASGNKIYHHCVNVWKEFQGRSITCFYIWVSNLLGTFPLNRPISPGKFNLQLTSFFPLVATITSISSRTSFPFKIPFRSRTFIMASNW